MLRTRGAWPTRITPYKECMIGKAREDKRNWLEEKAAAAEKAAEKGRNRELYNMTKAIVGERKGQEVDVRNKQGELKTEAREKLQRWVEHLVKY